MSRNTPFGHALLVQRHKNGIFGGVTDGIQLSQQELDEFLPAVFGNYWKAIDHDECVQALLQFNFILRFEICRPLLERGITAEKSFCTHRRSQLPLLLLRGGPVQSECQN